MPSHGDNNRHAIAGRLRDYHHSTYRPLDWWTADGQRAGRLPCGKAVTNPAINCDTLPFLVGVALSRETEQGICHALRGDNCSTVDAPDLLSFLAESTVCQNSPTRT